MNVLLIVPVSVGLADPFAYPPMGPLMIGAVLRAAGHEVDLIFAHWQPGMDRARYGKTEDLSTYTEGFDFCLYHVVGLNIFAEATFETACKILDEIPWNIWVIGGGAFVTSGTQEALDAGIDIGIIDEGEETIVELMSVLSINPFKVPHYSWSGVSPVFIIENDMRQELSKITGIAYIIPSEMHMTRMHVTPHRAYLRDLDRLPYPAWALIAPTIAAKETHVHLAPGKIQTTVFATRGCPWNCSFCNREVGGRLFRTHSPEYIINHLRYLRDRYGVTHVRFPDDMFTTVKSWVLEISRRLGEEGFTWVALSRTDTLDNEMAEAMAAGGCKGLFFGIESGSRRMLKLMNKKTTPEVNLEAIERCRKFGIVSSCYFIFGFPGEDAESVSLTRSWLERARPDRAHYSTFLPIHGTDPFRDPGKYAIRINPGYRNWNYYVDDLDEDFPVEYLPPNPPNDEMKALRQQFEETFIRLGYKRWKEVGSIKHPEPV